MYKDLLGSIATFNKNAFSQLLRGKIGLFFREVCWKFLLATLLGVVFSFVVLAKFVTFLLNHEIYRSYLYSLFLGLVLGSALFCSKKLNSFRFKHFLSFSIAATVAF